MYIRTSRTCNTLFRHSGLSMAPTTLLMSFTTCSRPPPSDTCTSTSLGLESSRANGKSGTAGAFQEKQRGLIDEDP
ncbi:hypothetical protein B0H12DRAFT_1106771 [Mycena haematopus]|nr:hypothetical protein B0H12DRAFT_1106771 [Mycena haematopus]